MQRLTFRDRVTREPHLRMWPHVGLLGAVAAPGDAATITRAWLVILCLSDLQATTESRSRCRTISLVIKTYTDVLRMVREVALPHLKVCLDAPIIENKDAAYLGRAVHDTGALQVQSHFGGEYERKAPGGPILRPNPYCS